MKKINLNYLNKKLLKGILVFGIAFQTGCAKTTNNVVEQTNEIEPNVEITNEKVIVENNASNEELPYTIDEDGYYVITASIIDARDLGNDIMNNIKNNDSYYTSDTIYLLKGQKLNPDTGDIIRDVPNYKEHIYLALKTDYSGLTATDFCDVYENAVDYNIHNNGIATGTDGFNEIQDISDNEIMIIIQETENMCPAALNKYNDEMSKAWAKIKEK
ncbi:MAG: hypothetical protein WBH68_08460 [Erysipelotrichaceae bacterium]